MALSYSARNWYWFIADDRTRVWSSAAANYVAIDDSTYQNWHAAGGIPTVTDSEASLRTTLLQQYPAGAPPTLATRLVQLAGISNAQQAYGVSFTPSTGSTAFVFPYDTDGRAMLTIAVRQVANTTWPSPNGLYKATTGVYAQMTSTDVTNLTNAMYTYVLACIAHEQTLATALLSNLFTDLTTGWPAHP